MLRHDSEPRVADKRDTQPRVGGRITKLYVTEVKRGGPFVGMVSMDVGVGFWL
jgi:hypothetical protein